MEFTNNEQKILFNVLESGPIEKKILANSHDSSVINNLISREVIMEIEIGGEPFLIINRECDPQIRKLHEDYCYKFTRCSREIVTLINTCLSDRKNIR